MMKKKHHSNFGAFNNYVDKSLPNFDSLLPRVEYCGLFTSYIPFDTWPSVDFQLTPPLLLVHVVIECPLGQKIRQYSDS